MNCSARFDPNHILWAFLNGADGVFLGACRPGDCHYGIGNLYAQSRIEDLKKQLDFYGIDPRRLHLEFLSGDDGEAFSRAITAFTHQVDKCKRMQKKTY
jgi:F420-non-reducing hydrogenase iron-sulfur subunit